MTPGHVAQQSPNRKCVKATICSLSLRSCIAIYFDLVEDRSTIRTKRRKRHRDVNPGYDGSHGDVRLGAAGVEHHETMGGASSNRTAHSGCHTAASMRAILGSVVIIWPMLEISSF